MNNLNLSLSIVSLLVWAQISWAQDEVTIIDQGPALVDVYSKPLLTTPYKERRSSKSILFEINADNYYPSDYASKIDQQFFNVMYGSEDLTLLQVGAGLQLNSGMGSFAFSLLYGQGSIENTVNSVSRTIELSKPALKLAYQIDTLWNEPYVVPYIGVDIWRMTFKETKQGSASAAFDTGVGTTYRAGALFQLNWMDPDAAITSYQDLGLQNTYLDLSFNQYSNSETGKGTSTFSDYNWAAGLRMEF